MQGIIGIECEVVILRLDQGCCKPEGDNVLINTQEIGMVVDRQQSGGDQSLLESLRQAQRPNFQRIFDGENLRTRLFGHFADDICPPGLPVGEQRVQDGGQRMHGLMDDIRIHSWIKIIVDDLIGRRVIMGPSSNHHLW